MVLCVDSCFYCSCLSPWLLKHCMRLCKMNQSTSKCHLCQVSSDGMIAVYVVNSFSPLPFWGFMQPSHLLKKISSRHYLIVSAVTNLLVNLLGVWFFRSYARVNIGMEANYILLPLVQMAILYLFPSKIRVET